jgi:activator of HSP90 ATPase
MSHQEGAEYSLWDGDVHGTNTKVVPYKLLEQDWFSENWPEASKVVFSFMKNERIVTVRLHQTGVPEGDFNDIDQGWHDYYLGPMKEFLEQQ